MSDQAKVETLKWKPKFKVGQVVFTKGWCSGEYLRIQRVLQGGYYDCGTLTAWREQELRPLTKREIG